MHAFSTLVELFGRLTGIIDPSVPLPIDSPLSGGKVPPPVLVRPVFGPIPSEEMARYDAVPPSVTEELPPATPKEPRLYEIFPTDAGISFLLPYNDGGMQVGLTHEEGRKLSEALINFYGLPANFYDGG